MTDTAAADLAWPGRQLHAAVYNNHFFLMAHALSLNGSYRCNSDDLGSPVPDLLGI